MACGRRLAVLRYRRLSLLTYLILALLVVATWMFLIPNDLFQNNRRDSSLFHHHIYDVAPRPGGGLVDHEVVLRKNTKNSVFAFREYPTNHSHPVLYVPEVANIAFERQQLKTPCDPVRMVEFYGEKITISKEPVCQWLENPKKLADGHFYLYGDQMALLYDVVVDAKYLGPGPRGGEKIEEVWGQAEENEYLDLKKGYFQLQCHEPPPAVFESKNHLSKWLQSLTCLENLTHQRDRVSGLTIAVQRYEYVNLYHTMTDYYNAFLAMLIFNQHPDNVTILWVDAHPQGGLDSVWSTLFGRVLRAGHLAQPTQFTSMAWAVMGYNSPLNQHSHPELPHLEEFRHFFLSRHKIDGSRALDCSALRLLFVWRKDYVAHPRNQRGNVVRKIHNEEELLTAIRGALGKEHVVNGLQLDAFSMEKQLMLITRTDILLGMHGAGLSLTLFLPPYGALLEFYPTYWPQANRHFRAMAAWRGLHYQTWQNQSPDNEKANHETYIPPDIVVKMVLEAKQALCGRNR